MWKSTSLSGLEYLIVWKDLGLSLMYASYVLFNLLLFFIICWIMLSDNIIIGLYELSRKMNWLNGCALIWPWYGVRSNLGETKLNFHFAKISFGKNVKGQRKP